MILILAEISDKHADRVESILRNNSAEYSRLNLDVDSVRNIQVRFEDNSFRIETPSFSFAASQIETVWNRSTLVEQYMEKCTNQDETYLRWKETWNKTLEGLFSSIESTKWLNFYPDSYSGDQFTQFTISKNTGLKWPSYICSNDINYLNSFFIGKKERILELMEQGCTKRILEDCPGKCGDKIGIAWSDSNSAKSCLVAGGGYQVRCSVVGRDYFVGKIKSGTVENVQVKANGSHMGMVVEPPESVKVKAIQIMEELNLTHGVFDFIVTDKNEWFFDALNPMGKYKWVEDIKGTDISLSIAKWLMMNN